MVRFFLSLISLLLVILLTSCASFNSPLSDGPTTDQQSKAMYDVWRLEKSEGIEAINKLLNESDDLMANQNFDAATDKLERVLRIKPEYAPAWSRLSWLAMQMNDAGRSIRMAKRSNSFAYANPELQLLNWSFIRDASQLLGDSNNYDAATRQIESLRAF